MSFLHFVFKDATIALSNYRIAFLGGHIQEFEGGVFLGFIPENGGFKKGVFLGPLRVIFKANHKQDLE